MLPRPNFGVRRLDLDAEAAQRVNGLTAQPGRAGLLDLKVAAAVDRRERSACFTDTVRFLEHEELELGADAVLESKLERFGQDAFERLARVGRKRRAAGQAHVADQARRRRGLPRQDREAFEVRSEIQVALGRAGHTFHRRPVEPGAVLERPLQPTDGNGQALDRAGYVRELQVHDFDAGGAGALDQLLQGPTCARCTSSAATPRAASTTSTPMITPVLTRCSRETTARPPVSDG